MKLLLKTIKITTLLVFSGMVVLTALAYLNLPVPLKPLVVMSGSMEPTIKTGSLVVVERNNLSNLQTNDIITFKSGKDLVSHRIFGITNQNGVKYFQTKGDANNNVDTSLVAEKDIVGKVGLSVPYMGKFVNFVKTPLGFILLITIPIFFIIISEILVIVEEIRKKGTGKTSNLEFAKPIAMFFVTAVFLTGTHAFFSDISTSLNNTFTAAPIFTNHLLISEVQIDGGTGEANNNDFVELYNPTTSVINLNGLRLVKRSSGSPTDSTIVTFGLTDNIPSHGFFLWGHKSSTNTFADTIAADIFSAVTLATNNSIAVKQVSDGTVIDALSWDSSINSLKEGTEFSPDPGVNQSLERKASSTSTSVTLGIDGLEEFKGNGFDTDNNATDFVSRSLAQPQNSSSATETP